MPGKDTRVVDMQFQNEQFEKNIATSQKSLSRFKKELNFEETSKGLEKFGKSVDSIKFDRFFDNIQRLTDKFTGIGDVGEFMISKVRNALEQAANSAITFVKSITFDQIDEGKQKFEDLNKSIQTIMAATGKAEGEVAGILERLNLYTDQTSYNFSDMAANIGKFTSVGIPLEQAEKQMEGIANWAARSGAGIQEASRAMYNLSQAMGVGSLKMIDWKSIENAGMATKEFKEQLIEAGLAAGTIVATTKKDANGVEKTVYKTASKLGKQVEVTFQNMSTTLNKGWANTTVLGNTLMGYYYDALTDTEQKEQEKFIKTVTDDQKTMLDKIFKEYGKIDETNWSKLATEGLVDDTVKQRLLDTAESYGLLTTEVNEDGTKIYKTFDKAGKAIEFTFDTFEKGLKGNWLTRGIAKAAWSFDDLAKGSYDAAMKCLTLTDVLNAWKDMMSTGWMAAFQKVFGGLGDSMTVFTAICNKVGDSLSAIFGTEGAINKILGHWETFGGRKSLWSMIVGDYDDVGDQIEKDAYGLVDIIKDVGSIISEAFWDIVKEWAVAVHGEGAIQDWMDDPEYRFEFLADRIAYYTNEIRWNIQKVKDWFQSVPEGFDKSRWEIIKDVVKAVLRAVTMAVNIIEGLYHFGERIVAQLSPSFKAIGDLLYSLVNGFSDTSRDLSKNKGIQTFFENFAETLRPVTDIINKVVVGITTLIKKFIKWGVEGGNFVKIGNAIKTVFEKIVDIVSKIAGPVIDFFKNLGPSIQDFFTKGITKETVANFVKTIGRSLSNMLGTFANYIPGIWDKIRNAISTVFGYAKDYLQSEGPSLLTAVIDFIRNLFGGIGNFLTKLGERYSDENSLFSILKRLVGTGITKLAEYVKSIKISLSGICLYDVIMAFLGGFAIIAAFGLLSQVIGILKGIKWITQGLGDIFDSIRKRIYDPTTQFKNIAIAIALLAGSIALLGQMTWEEAARGVAAIAAGCLVIIGTIWAVNKITKKVKASNIIKVSASIISISVALLFMSLAVKMLVNALKPIADYDWEQLGKMGAGLAGILTIFTLFGLVAKYTKVSAKSMMAFGLLGIGVGIMVNALMPLANMDWDKLEIMGAGLAGVLIMLALFSHIAGNIGGKGVGQTAFLAFGISILVNTLIPLADYDWPKLEKMAVSLLGVLVILAIFSRISGSLKGKHMRSVIAVGIGLWLLMKSIMPLAEYDWEKLGKIGASLMVILSLLGYFAKKSGSLKGKSMKSAIMLVASIYILMETMKPLADYSWEKLGKIEATIGATLSLLGYFTKKSGSLKKKGMFNAIFVAGSIYILMEAMKPIADYDWEKIGKIESGLAVTMSILGYFTKKSGKLKGKGTFNLIFLAASIYIVMEAIKPLADYNWEQLGKMGAGLLGMVLMLSLFSRLLGKIKIVSIVSLVIFGGAIYLMLQTLMPLANYSWDDLAKMGVGLLACVVMFGIISKKIKDIKFTNGAGAFAALLGLAAVISVFGKTLANIKDADMSTMLAFSASVVILSIACRIILSAISKLPATNNWTEILGKLAIVAIALVAVGALMWELSALIPAINNADIKNLLAFSVAVDLVMPSLYIAAMAMNKIKSVHASAYAPIGPEIVSKVAMMVTSFIAVGVLMYELAYLIPKINDADIKALLGFSVAVDVLMPALILAAIGMNKLTVPGGTGTRIVGKIAMMFTTLIAVGTLMYELAYVADMVKDADIVKLLAFTVAVDLLMPALYLAASAINKIKPVSGLSSIIGKILMMAMAIIAVGTLMGEMAMLVPVINQADILKLFGFVVAVDLLMPALYIASMAINNLQTNSGQFGEKGMPIKSLLAKILLTFTAIIAVGVLMGELALLIPNINQADIGKLFAFVGAVELLVPSLITVAAAINTIKIPNAYKSTNKQTKGGLFNKNGKNKSTSEEGLAGAKDLSGLVALIGMAIIAVSALMWELALMIPLIDKMDINNGSIQKLIGFVGAVELLVPSLITVAYAISKIKVPEFSKSSSSVSNSSSIDALSKKKSSNSTTKDDEKRTATFGDLKGLMALIGIAVLAVSWMMLELSLLIPLIDRMDISEGSIKKLLSFVGAVEGLMPSLIIVAMAINKINVPKMGSKSNFSKKIDGLKGKDKTSQSESTSSTKEYDAQFGDLKGLMALIAIAVAAVSWIMLELSLLIPLIDRMDINDGSIGKLLTFVGAVDALMPSLIIVATAIDKLKVPTIGDSKSSRPARAKELSGFIAVLAISIAAVSFMMAELALLIPLINKMEPGWEGFGKLAGFAAAVDILMVALIPVTIAISNLKVPTIDGPLGRPAKAKELSGFMAVLGIAIVAVAGLMAELAALIPMIDKMQGLDSIVKLAGFAVAVDLLMPSLIIVVEAINRIKISKVKGSLFKKIALITTAAAIVALLGWGLAAIIPMVDQMKDLSSIVKLIGFIAAIDLVIPALFLVVTAINKIKTPSSLKAVGKKIMVIAAAGAVLSGIAFVLAKLIPLVDQMRDYGSLIKLAGFAVVIDLLMPALYLIVTAFNKIQTPKNGKDIARKLAVLGGAMVVIIAMIGTLALLAPKINEADLIKMIGISAAICLLAVALSAIAMTISKIKAPDNGRELGRKLAILGAAFAVVALLTLEMALLASKINDAKIDKVIGFAIAIDALMPALLIAVVAINKVKTPMLGKDLGKKLAVIGVAFAIVALLMGELALLTSTINESKIDKMIGFAIAVDALMASLLIVVLAINKINVPIAKDDVKKKFGLLAMAVGSVAVICLAFAGAMRLAGNIDPLSTLAFSAGVAVIALALSMLIKSVNKIETKGMDKGSIKKRIGIIILALVPLGALMAELAFLLNKTEGVDPVNMLAFSGSMVGIALAMSIMLKALSSIKVNKNTAGFGKQFGTMLTAVIAIGAIMYVFAQILENTKDIDPTNMLAFSASVAILAIVMGIVARTIGSMKVNNVAKKSVLIIAIAVAISGIAYVLGKSIKEVKGVNWEVMAAFAAGLSVMLLAMALAIKILQGVSLGAGIKAIVLAVSGITALLLAISAILPYISTQIGKAIENLAVYLDRVGIMLSSFSNSMGNVDESTINKSSSIIDTLSSTLRKLTGFAGLSKDMSSFAIGVWDIGATIAMFYDLTKDIPRIEDNGAIQLLNYFRDNVNSITSIKFGETPIGIAELGAGLYVFNDVTKELNMEEGKKHPGIQMIEALISLASSMSAGYFLTFASFGAGVAKLGSGLSSFFTDVSGSFPSNPEEDPRFKTLKAFADMAPDIQTLLGLELDKLGGKLSELGGGMNIYALGAKNMSGVSEDESAPDVSKAIEVTRSIITQLNGLAGEYGGKIEFPDVPKEDESTTFGVRMAVLAGGLQTFINACEGFNGKTQQGLDAVKLLSDINTNLTADTLSVIERYPNSVSIIGIGAFALDLITLATGLKSFIWASDGINGNTDKGLAAITMLTRLNHKLTNDVVRTITFFDSKEISNTMLAKLGVDLVTLASGMNDFVNVEVGDLTTKFTFLDQIAELNSRLTSSKIEELTQTMSAYLTPVDTSKLSDKSYADYLNKVAEITNGDNSTMAAFTHGIGLLGKALKEFADTVMGPDSGNYFDSSYDEAWKKAKEAIEFFIQMTKEMPPIPTGAFTIILSYEKDLGNLSPSIKYLGNALAEFGKDITEAWNAGNWDTVLIESSLNAIATMVEAYVGIAGAVESFYNFLKDNDSADFSLQGATKVIDDYLDTGRVVKLFSKQLGFLITSMYSNDITDADGNSRSVISVFAELMGKMKTEMDSFNISKEDIETMLMTFDALTKVVSALSSKEVYPSFDKPIANYLHNMLKDVSDALFTEGGELQTNMEALTELVGGFGDSLTTLMRLGEKYVSPDSSRIQAVADDYGTVLDAMLTSTQEIFKKLGIITDDGIDYEVFDTFEKTSQIMDHITNAYKVMVNKPAKLEDVGELSVEAIANGIKSSDSVDIVLAAINQLMNEVSDKQMTKIFESLNQDGDLFSISLEAMGIHDIMTNNIYDTISDLKNAVDNPQEGQKWTFLDVGFYMAAGLAKGMLNGSPLVAKAAEQIIDEAKAAAMKRAMERSPSRLFAMIGGYLSEGMAIGITGKEDLVKASSEGMVNSAIQTVATAMAIISGLMSQDGTDTTPTISPVLDFNQAEEQLKQWSGRKLPGNLNFTGTHNLSMSLDASQFETLAPRDYSSQLETLGTTVITLQENIKDMSEKLNNFKVVMNTGAVVGALGPGIDQYLGRSNFTAGRGVV